MDRCATACIVLKTNAVHSGGLPPERMFILTIRTSVPGGTSTRRPTVREGRACRTLAIPNRTYPRIVSSIVDRMTTSVA